MVWAEHSQLLNAEAGPGLFLKHAVDRSVAFSPTVMVNVPWFSGTFLGNMTYDLGQDPCSQRAF